MESFPRNQQTSSSLTSISSIAQLEGRQISEIWRCVQLLQPLQEFASVLRISCRTFSHDPRSNSSAVEHQSLRRMDSKTTSHQVEKNLSLVLISVVRFLSRKFRHDLDLAQIALRTRYNKLLFFPNWIYYRITSDFTD